MIKSNPPFSFTVAQREIDISIRSNRSFHNFLKREDVGSPSHTLPTFRSFKLVSYHHSEKTNLRYVSNLHIGTSLCYNFEVAVKVRDIRIDCTR